MTDPICNCKAEHWQPHAHYCPVLLHVREQLRKSGESAQGESAAAQLYVWFAKNKGTERDGEQFIRAWTHDPARVDGLRNAIGKEPTIYFAILQAATRDTASADAIDAQMRSIAQKSLYYLEGNLPDGPQDQADFERHKNILKAIAANAPKGDGND